MLAVVAAATACAGHDEVAALAQWAADAPEWVLAELGAKPDPLTGAISAPSESTLRRVLAKVDAAQLQRLTAQWVKASAGTTPARQGKSDWLGWPLTARAFAARPPGAILARTYSLRSPTTARSCSPNARSGDKGSEISELAALVTALEEQRNDQSR